MESDDHHHHGGHAHDHGHHHEHGHAHSGRRPWIAAWETVFGHSHDIADSVDTALEADRRGMRALWLSFLILAATAAVQGWIVWLSGSVALLGDTLHNVADALTAVPLAIAFTLGRRPANDRYTYGYGRAEDLAGVLIVLLIALSAAAAAVVAVGRLLHPHTMTHLGAVAAAALLGFLGNEAVAQYRMRTGRLIGSAALVADGLHARTDGFTSLAVLLGVAGAASGLPWADAVVGILITLAILSVLRSAWRTVYARLMDAVDRGMVAGVAGVLRSTEGVRDVGTVRLRWIGHQLRVECEVVVDAELSLLAAHAIAHDAEHALLHAFSRLSAAAVHAEPAPVGDVDHHEAVRHHRSQPNGATLRSPSRRTGR